MDISLEPRIELEVEGGILPPGLKLPDLAAVRANAKNGAFAVHDAMLTCLTSLEWL
jgi:hypothetical protein